MFDSKNFFSVFKLPENGIDLTTIENYPLETLSSKPEYQKSSLGCNVDGYIQLVKVHQPDYFE